MDKTISNIYISMNYNSRTIKQVNFSSDTCMDFFYKSTKSTCLNARVAKQISAEEKKNINTIYMQLFSFVSRTSNIYMFFNFSSTMKEYKRAIDPFFVCIINCLCTSQNYFVWRKKKS